MQLESLQMLNSSKWQNCLHVSLFLNSLIASLLLPTTTTGVRLIQNDCVCQWKSCNLRSGIGILYPCIKGSVVIKCFDSFETSVKIFYFNICYSTFHFSLGHKIQGVEKLFLGLSFWKVFALSVEAYHYYLVQLFFILKILRKVVHL